MDLTKILLVTLAACGLEDKSLRKLFIFAVNLPVRWPLLDNAAALQWVEGDLVRNKAFQTVLEMKRK